MRKRSIRAIASVAAAAIALGLAAYIVRRPKSPPPTASPLSTPVSVRMKWFYAGTMAPWFAGRDQQMYRSAGIDLTVRPGGPDNSAVKLVAAGSDDFGVAGADEVLMARAQGIPIVAVGVLFKDSPICFISKQRRGITSPAQWTGKTVEVSYGSNAEVQYRALVKKFAAKNLKEVPYTFNLVPFVTDKVDVSVAYAMDQVVTLQRKGIKLNIIAARDHGVNPYGDVVITTERTLHDRPALVRQFMDATVRSFQWAIDHPKDAASALVEAAPDLKLDNELEVWRATIPFLTSDGGKDAIGRMRPERWQQTMDELVEFRFLKAPVDLTKAYTAAF